MKENQQIALFNDIGSNPEFAKLLTSNRTVEPAKVLPKLDKRNRPMKDPKTGQPLMRKVGPKDVTVLKVLPRTAGIDEDTKEQKPCIKFNTNYTGQQLMAFEQENCIKVASLVSAYLTQQIAEGKLGFKSLRRNNLNGNLALNFKGINAVVTKAGLTMEDALKVLGITKEQYESVKPVEQKPIDVPAAPAAEPKAKGRKSAAPAPSEAAAV